MGRMGDFQGKSIYVEELNNTMSAYPNRVFTGA